MHKYYLEPTATWQHGHSHMTIQPQPQDNFTTAACPPAPPCPPPPPTLPPAPPPCPLHLCTPPIPPVANTRTPAKAASSMVPDTVVAPSKPLAITYARSRRDTYTGSRGQGSGGRGEGAEFRMEGAEWRAQGVGCRAQGPGFREKTVT